MLRLIKHAVPDPKPNNWTALTCLVPEHWSLREQLYWVLEDVTSPVRFFANLGDQMAYRHMKPSPFTVQPIPTILTLEPVVIRLLQQS